MLEGQKITTINIEEEMKSAYIDYSMSVIVSRALPDVRDGLKPVHRRVLFGMSELGLYANRPYKKSARIVGEVLGKYHPHGDSSVYEAMVRMAQPWAMRYQLVDGQGNFGSVDGDSPAAMRYTEARLRRISETTLTDIDKNTVDFQLNFDDSLEEPTVLPTRLPVLLVNGATGIAVGMATSIPPHNLREVIDAIVAYIDNNDIEVPELLQHIKGPDFPTGGTIYGVTGIKDAYSTGKGKIVVRAKSQVEVTSSGRDKIVVTEIPYMVNKAEMIKKIADLINEKKLEGISYINDESDRTGMRIVIILKKDTNANVILNKLYKYSQLQTTFNVNSIALVDGRPKLLNIKQFISQFVKHRHEVVVRRTRYDLEQAEQRAHVLEGLLIALDHLDEVINLIRNSKTPDEAKNGLITTYELTEVQAKAILDMRLQRLTGLERDKIKEEYEGLKKLIKYLNDVLEDESLRMSIINDELVEVRDKFGDERRTEIVPEEGEFNPEDFYADEDVVITISHLGYIKRVPLTEFRTQNRGGIGVKGSSTREEDFLEYMFHARNHNTLLLFTKKGKCFWIKVYEIPEGSKASKGRAVQNLLQIEQDDYVQAFINVDNLTDPEYIKNNYIILATQKGTIKKTALEAYSRPRQKGINAVNLRENDRLIEAKLTNGNNEILLAVKSGKAIRFNESLIRVVGRNATGVKGITLGSREDEVVSMVCLEDPEQQILTVSEKGFGKKSMLKDYRVTNRGGKGVKTMNINEKTGKLIALKAVSEEEDLMIINKSGTIIRLALADIRTTGRATRGVKLLNIREGDSIASVINVPSGDQSFEEPESGEEAPENPQVE